MSVMLVFQKSVSYDASTAVVVLSVVVASINFSCCASGDSSRESGGNLNNS